MVRGSKVGTLLAVLLLGGAGAASADTKIFKYDSKGRVISVEKGKKPPSTPPSRGGAGDEDSLERDFVPGELVVVVRSGRVGKKAAALGFVLLDRTRLGTLDFSVIRLKAPAGMTTEKALEVLRSRFPSAILDKNHRFRPSGAKAKPRMDYAIALTGWGKVPASCGRDLRLGMIDGLPNVKHPQLAGQRLTTRAFVKKNQTAAVLGHSTSIAGLLIGKPYKTHPGGLLPGAALYVGGIFRRLPNGKVRGNLIGFLKALDWLAKKRVAVVNVSLVAADNKVMQRILRRSVKNGQVMVASVSNRGAKAKTPYPAGYREVLLVPAIDHQRKVFRKASHGDYVDFAAPGVGLVLAAGKGFKRRSGTSYAAPFLTSVAAILIQGGNPPDPDLMRGKLRRYVVDLGKPGHDDVYGHGLVRARPPC